MDGTLDLKPIPLAAVGSLLEHGQPDLTFYISGSSAKSPVLYRAAGFGLAQPDFARLHGSGVSALFIRGEHLGQCEQVLEEELSRVLQDPGIPPVQKAEYVRYVGTTVARDLIAGPGEAIDLHRATRLLDTVIEGILADTAVRSSLLKVAAHHRSTASHMFAVSALAVMLAFEAFGADRQFLKEVGLAGMLHDVGKVSIPEETLNKTTPLSFTETQLFRHHPVESVRLLGTDSQATSAVRQMILQHHERVDGQGYPLGLSGSCLLPGSRILSIIDSFHAMIGHRTYREPLTPRDANRRLAYQVGKQFDPELFRRWLELFGRCWPDSTEAGVIFGSPEPGDHGYHQDHQPMQRPPVIPRGQPRFRCDSQVQVGCIYAGRLHDASAASNGFVSRVYNISASGTCLGTGHPMYRGEIVHLLLRMRGHDVWVRSMVAWCRKDTESGSFRTGVQFLHRISPHEANLRVQPWGLGGISYPVCVAS